MVEYFEDKLKTALEYESAGVSASDALKQKIDSKLGRQKEEKYLPDILPAERKDTMKNDDMSHTDTKRFRFSAKKMIIGVVAACLLLSGAAFAGKTAFFASSTKPGTEYDSYGNMEKALKKLGHEADTIESFSCGYDFKEARVNYTDARDGEGNTIYTFPELWLYYEKEGEPILSLVVEKPREDYENKKEPDLVRQYGEIELYYDRYTYKVVPPDYELTEEDRENEKRDDYYISYGSDKVEIKHAMHVTWMKNGIHYNLFGFDLNLSGDEMMDMAEEILKLN